MIEIKPRHCRVVHIGNDLFHIKTAVIANHNGNTYIFGVEDDKITKKDMAHLIRAKD